MLGPAIARELARNPMRTHIQQTALGDVVVAAFDEAARYGNNPREVSRLATQAVAHILLRQPLRRGRTTAFDVIRTANHRGSR